MRLNDNISIGWNQLTNPTPPWLKKVARIFFYSTGVIAIVLDVFTEIPPHIKLVICTSVIKANLLVTGLSKLFGIDPKQFFEQKSNTPV